MLEHDESRVLEREDLAETFGNALIAIMNDPDDESVALRHGSALTWRTSLLNQILKLKMDTIDMSVFNAMSEENKDQSSEANEKRRADVL